MQEDQEQIPPIELEHMEEDEELWNEEEKEEDQDLEEAIKRLSGERKNEEEELEQIIKQLSSEEEIGTKETKVENQDSLAAEKEELQRKIEEEENEEVKITIDALMACQEIMDKIHEKLLKKPKNKYSPAPLFHLSACSFIV